MGFVLRYVPVPSASPTGIQRKIYEKKHNCPIFKLELKTPQGFYVFSTLLRLSCKLHSIQDALMLTSICYTL